VRFGIALESFTPPDKMPGAADIYEMSEHAEKLGFDSVWAWDHLLLGSRKVFPVLDSLTTLSMIGARTSTLKVGTSVLIMSLRNPLVLAKMLSTIQFMTNGRLLLGTATGWYRREFDAVGVDFEKRGKIFEDHFKLVRSLLSENDVNYAAGGQSITHANLQPKPSKSIPMLLGGYAERVLERAGRMADGWIGYYYPPDGFEEAWGTVKQSAKNANRSESLMGINIVPYAPASSFEEGDAIAKDFTAKYMDLPREGTHCSVDSAVRGTPSDCARQVEAYRAAGVQGLVLIPCFYRLEYLTRAADEILPSFRA
jgi:alkanesulfonate monooxygenase SsuD/methylene tetrahydromethanopterin reductase-like flavin-dependent oxidoreductase (luciferase family)